MALQSVEPVRHPLWYKDAVIYQLHVKTFADSNGNGLGDFRGLCSKLDYLRELGVTALWLLPFYPSPLRDDGYDIADFKDIHPSYGNLHDFKSFLKEAHRRGLRVITELVINHTSDQHPWFQRARHAKAGSAWRDFYVWSETVHKFEEARVIFQDFETSNWTWDPVAGAYYWHRFYTHQPDLNFDNPKVRREVVKALEFWLDMGVDGLRLDAVPYLYEREGTNCENLPETHAFLRQLRAGMDNKYRDRMLLAEANQWPEDAAAYFGQGDECHMNFHFPLMPRLYMALHMEDRHPVVDILEQTPEIPAGCQWAIFLRNHDELTLEMVTDEERDYMYRVYARDPRMRLNLGIRRRLAPLLGNHRRRIELMNGLLLSLPGTPVIYYGDEIGMGDNIYLGDRNGVRTPMQWSPDRNAGFSTANPQRLYLPVIIDPEYHYEVVNVESQRNNRHSLLWWMRRLITLRNRIKAFSQGNLTFLHPDNEKIMAFIRNHEDVHILVVINFSRFVQFTYLDLSGYEGRVPVEVFGNTHFPAIGDDPYILTMGPHSFYWFNLAVEQPAEAPPSTEVDPARLPLFVFGRRWQELFDGGLSAELTEQITAYLNRQRWFGAKQRRTKNLSIREVLPINDGEVGGYLLFTELEYLEGTAETYILAVAHTDNLAADQIFEKYPAAPIVRVQPRDRSTDGYLLDGLADPLFCRLLLKMIARRTQSRGLAGRLTAVTTAAMRAMPTPVEEAEEVTIIAAEQSNTSVKFGDRLVLKLFRRLQDGVNPDLEIGLFLTRRNFSHMPQVAGALEYRLGDGEPATAVIVQQYVRNQGDAWQFTLNSLSRFFEYVRENPVAAPDLPSTDMLVNSEREIPEAVIEHLGFYLESVKVLAQRTAGMHAVLSSERYDPAFAPENFSRLYQRSLYQSMRSSALRTLSQLEKALPDLPDPLRPLAGKILTRQDGIMGLFRRVTETKLTGRRLRCHGDYHLGQVLFTGKDFIIIDFEGEPARSISERRIKRSPLRDVAGMLRSFHYAGHSALALEKMRGLFHEPDMPYMEAWADYWYRWVAAVFLKFYRDHSRGCDYLPSDGEHLRILLNAYLMEKAMYELAYEMNNRPEWVGIPLKGIDRLLEAFDEL